MSVHLVDTSKAVPPATHDQQTLALLTEIRDLLKTPPRAKPGRRKKRK